MKRRQLISTGAAAAAAAVVAAPARAQGTQPTIRWRMPSSFPKALPTVNAPLTGIFYRAASPQTDAFVQVGSVVESGQVIGLIEAMKLFNEIRSTESGRVRRIFAENGQLVRAHQPLLEVEPS